MGIACSSNKSAIEALQHHMFEYDMPLEMVKQPRHKVEDLLISNANNVALLRESFEVLKRNRDGMALKVHEQISLQINGAASMYKKLSVRPVDCWTANTGLGMVLLSGIERFLLRLEDPKKLSALANLIKKHHQEVYAVDHVLMARALSVAHVTFIQEFRRIYGADLKRISIAWDNFFDLLRQIILA